MMTINLQSDDAFESRHDQLPHLEQARFGTTNQRSNTWWNRRRFQWLIGILATVFIAFIAAGIGVSVTRNKTRMHRYSEVISYLKHYSDPDALQTEGTPQYRAAKWLADEDPIAYDVPHSGVAGHHFRQRYALAVFYFATGGAEWNNSWNFLSETNECFWNQISKVNQYPVPFGVTCDEDQDVLAIVNGENQLYGELPPEIGMLTKLNFLWLPENSLYGELPSELRAVTDMDTFNIDKNSFHGSIPDWVGDWSRATFLSLQQNQFTGSLPSAIGQLNMLMTLQLTKNKFTGTIPVGFLDLRYLERLLLGHNRFEGELSPWLPTHLEGLSGLSLNNNQFTGSLPESFRTLTALTRLSLDGNHFTGEIKVLNSLTNLEALFLQQNIFEERIDRGTNFLNNLKVLRVFDGSNNAFYGSVPLDLLTHDTLQILDMRGNALSGGLPNDLPENTALEFLSLKENTISHHIPPCISNFTALHHLDLSSNSMGGGLIPELGELSKLTYLSLADNAFGRGEVPDFLRKLTKLHELSLRITGLTGSIPDWISELNKLTLLDLDYNELTGTIPETLGTVKSLKYVLLNKNQLNGTVQSSIQLLPNLSFLMLGENNLRGDLSYVCNGDSLIQNLDEVHADCAGPNPEIACSCCTCCDQNGAGCSEASEALAERWESSYRRSSWDFVNNLEDIF